MRHCVLALSSLVACTAPAPAPASIEQPADAERTWVVASQVPTMDPQPGVPKPLPRKPGRLDVTPREAGDGILPNRPRALIDPQLGSPMDSIELFGWTVDSQRFEHCHPTGGRGGFGCESHGVDGKKSMFDDVGEREDVDAEKNRAIRARMARLVRDADSWAWGGAIEILWRDRQGDDGRPGSVDVGARLRDSDARAFPVRLELDEFAAGNLELVIPSPDGEHLALVAHGFAGEFSDTFTTSIVAVDELAAAAYHAAGYEALRLDDLAGAIDRFAAATSLSTMWHGPYDLACARARADAPNVEAALREAIRRGGDTVRRKARHDQDLVSVRYLPWFTDLVGA